VKNKIKKIEKSIEKMQLDVNDDLKIFLITKKNDRMIVRQMNEVCLDFLLKKSMRLLRRCDKLKTNFNNAWARIRIWIWIWWI